MILYQIKIEMLPNKNLVRIVQEGTPEEETTPFKDAVA